LSEREKRRRRAEKRNKKNNKNGDDDDETEDMGNANDEVKLEMIHNLNSAKLLMISEQFDEYPGQEVDVQQFVDIMMAVMRGTKAY
jgi:hypothetical protein